MPDPLALVFSVVYTGCPCDTGQSPESASADTGNCAGEIPDAVDSKILETSSERQEMGKSTRSDVLVSLSDSTVTAEAEADLRVAIVRECEPDGGGTEPNKSRETWGTQPGGR